VIATALEKDRDLRYQHASDLQAELKRLRRDMDSMSVVGSQPAVLPSRESVTVPDRTAAAVEPPAPTRSLERVTVVVAVLAAFAGGLWVWLGQRATVEPVTESAVSQPSAAPEPPPDANKVAPPIAAAPAPAPAPPVPTDRPAVATPSTRQAQPVEPPRDGRRPPEPQPQTPAASAPSRPPQVNPVAEAPSPVAVFSPATPLPTSPGARNATTTPAQSPAADPAAPPQTPAGNPPAAATSPPVVATPPAVAATPPAVASNPPASTTPAPRVAPSPPATPSPQQTVPAETDEAAIRRVIRTYEQAIETKDIVLFRSVRPGLTQAAEAVLRNSFQQVDSQEVDIRVDSLNVEARTATARITRRDTLVTGGRRRTENSSQTLRFERTASGWVISE
jgi:hypothetical protein